MTKKIEISSFSRNVATLLTGTIFAQAFPLICMPILTRIYAPEDFGLLALFTAFILTLGAVATARYEMAIILPKKDENAFHVAILGMIIATLFSFITLVVVLFFSHDIALLAGNLDLKFWLYFVPIVVWLIGLFNVLNYLNTRLKNYKDIAISNVQRSSFLVSVQLLFGFLSSINTGLIIGLIVSHFTGNYRLFKVSLSKLKEYNISKGKMYALAKRYKNFPKFSVAAIFANNLAVHSINFFISFLYNIKTLGFYSLTQKMLGMPTALIGNSIGQVYLQEAALEKKKKGTAIESFSAAIKKLTILACLFFIPLYFISEDLFAFVFGEDWRVAGEYARTLIPMFFIRFISVSLSSTNSLFEKQKISFIWQIILLLLTSFIFGVGSYFSINFEYLLTIYSSVIGFHYFLLLGVVFLVSRGRL